MDRKLAIHAKPGGPVSPAAFVRKALVTVRTGPLILETLLARAINPRESVPDLENGSESYQGKACRLEGQTKLGFGIALYNIAVPDDCTVEIPPEDGRQRILERGFIFYSGFYRPGHSRVMPAAHSDAEKQLCPDGFIAAKVEDQLGEDQSS